MIGWLIAALAVCALVAAGTFKGYQAGEDHMRAEFDKAQAEARQQAEAARQADQQAARKTAQTLQTALNRQRSLARNVDTQLEAALRREAANRPDGCPDPVISDGVRDLINRALAGGSGAAGTVLPSGSGAAADADRSVLPGADSPAGVGR